jgi:hypothetical protein
MRKAGYVGLPAQVARGERLTKTAKNVEPVKLHGGSLQSRDTEQTIPILVRQDVDMKPCLFRTVEVPSRSSGGSCWANETTALTATPIEPTCGMVSNSMIGMAST